MSRNPPVPKRTRSKPRRIRKDQGRQSDYAVGYGCPPEHTRFAKGVSGNPAGRPKGRKNLATIIKETLTGPIVMREGDRTRRVPIFEAIILKQIENGLKGNDKAAFALIKIAGQVGLLGDAEPGAGVALSREEQLLMSELLQRVSASDER